jgi:hypothetical protein
VVVAVRKWAERTGNAHGAVLPVLRPHVDTSTTKKVKKKKETILQSITNFTVSYVAASDAVEITFGANETFPSSGQITVLGGLTTAAGGTLSGPAVFTIAKGGKSVGPS